MRVIDFSGAAKSFLNSCGAGFAVNAARDHCVGSSAAAPWQSEHFVTAWFEETWPGEINSKRAGE